MSKGSNSDAAFKVATASSSRPACINKYPSSPRGSLHIGSRRIASSSARCPHSYCLFKLSVRPSVAYANALVGNFSSNSANRCRASSGFQRRPATAARSARACGMFGSRVNKPSRIASARSGSSVNNARSESSKSASGCVGFSNRSRSAARAAESKSKLFNATWPSANHVRLERGSSESACHKAGTPCARLCRSTNNNPSSSGTSGSRRSASRARPN